jgi:hypothetical protein
MVLAQIQLSVLLFPPILYAALALCIRPPRRIIALSLLIGLLLGCINMLGDMLAYGQGWWRYPFTTASHAPLTFYLGAGLFYGERPQVS